MSYSHDYKTCLAKKQGQSPRTDKGGVGIFSTTGQVIAKLVEDKHGQKFVQKSIKVSIHALRTPPGLGMDTDALHQAKKLGATYILVIDKESGTRWWTWLDTMLDKGFSLNRGFGNQIGLPWAFWNDAKQVPPGTETPPISEIVVRPKPKQFDLFDGGATNAAA